MSNLFDLHQFCQYSQFTTIVSKIFSNIFTQHMYQCETVLKTHVLLYSHNTKFLSILPLIYSILNIQTIQDCRRYTGSLQDQHKSFAWYHYLIVFIYIYILAASLDYHSFFILPNFVETVSLTRNCLPLQKLNLLKQYLRL